MSPGRCESASRQWCRSRNRGRHCHQRRSRRATGDQLPSRRQPLPARRHGDGGHIAAGGNRPSGAPMTENTRTNGQVISTRGLTKRYGDLRAVDAVDLDVAEGDVYGFLGANGSGKTTTVRMLLGLVLPTSGETRVLGKPMPAARRAVLPNIGALVEAPGSYPHPAGRGNRAPLDATGADRRSPKKRR